MSKYCVKCRRRRSRSSDAKRAIRLRQANLRNFARGRSAGASGDIDRNAAGYIRMGGCARSVEAGKPARCRFSTGCVGYRATNARGGPDAGIFTSRAIIEPPSEDDPQRAIQAAVTSIRSFGALFAFVGIISYLALKPRGSTWLPLLAASCTPLGMCVMLSSAFIAKRRRWAIILAAITASALALITTAAAVVVLLGVGIRHAVFPVAGTVMAIRLIQHVWRAYVVVHLAYGGGQRGFEVIRAESPPSPCPVADPSLPGATEPAQSNAAN